MLRASTQPSCNRIALQDCGLLTSELAKERRDHDQTREQLSQAKAAAGRSGSLRSPAASAGGSPAGAGSGAAASGAGANTAGRSSRKRPRMTAVDEVDEDMQGILGIILCK